MSVMLTSLFPPGTPVCVRQETRLRGMSLHNETVGIVEAWQEQPTGSWYAHGGSGKLWLLRLALRKADGERTLLVLDDATSIAKLEAVSSGAG